MDISWEEAKELAADRTEWRQRDMDEQNRTEQQNSIFLFCILKILFGVFCYLQNIFEITFLKILYTMMRDEVTFSSVQFLPVLSIAYFIGQIQKFFEF